MAIEPMINLGLKDIVTDKDGWTIKTKDGKFCIWIYSCITVEVLI